jgi:gamma-glutamylcyclotransferase (GGCT)/AIG2-like uncharacterized protein YtfP
MIHKVGNDRRQPRKGFLFSYGTLLPQVAPREIAPTVQGLRRVGRGFIRGHLFDFGSYPGAILDRNGPQIADQVFELPDDPQVLDRLDRFEGVDHANPERGLFVRKRRKAQLEDGRRLFCWVYAYNRTVKAAQPLLTGDYMESRRQVSS